MNNELKKYYRQIRARWHGNTASSAIASARRHIAGPLAEFRAKLAAWEAEPDKRRYAPGGYANRPKYPELYRRKDAADMVPDGYQLFGFLCDDSPSRGMSDSPDYGYYADTYQDATYYPCVLVRRTSEPHTWACVPAYYDAQAECYVFDDRNPRDLARSGELFDQSSYRQGAKLCNGYDLCRDMKDAARSALSLAENAAEKSHEYDERWQEASRADSERDEAREELKQARADARLVVAALRQQRAQGVAPMVCDLLRAKMQECRNDMQRAIETIREKTDAIAALDMQGEF